MTSTATTSTKLSDTQLVILSVASQREDRAVVLPNRLTGGAANKVVKALANKGLVEPVAATPGKPIWRESEDGRHVALRITDAGLLALGIEPDAPAQEKAPAEEPGPARTRKGDKKLDAKADETAAEAAPSTGLRQRRTGTKQALLIEMLKRPEGATVPEIMDATRWLSHTVRGAISGALKKKLGLVITTETIDGRGRVYRLG
jgi:hypothetical protein